MEKKKIDLAFKILRGLRTVARIVYKATDAILIVMDEEIDRREVSGRK